MHVFAVRNQWLFIIYKSFRKTKVVSKWAMTFWVTPAKALREQPYGTYRNYCSIFSKLSLTAVFSFVDNFSFVYQYRSCDNTLGNCFFQI